jgi:Uma2 family endonuclease
LREFKINIPSILNLLELNALRIEAWIGLGFRFFGIGSFVMATVKLCIGPADQGRGMTVEEFREADEEEGFRYELARGVLEVTEVPNDPHGKVVDNLREAISGYRRRRPGLIFRIGGGGEFRLWIPGRDSGRNPDLGIVFQGTPKDERGRRPPYWVAEVVSPGGENRDYVEKPEEYSIFGILEYWIVDPQLRRVTVLNRTGDRGDLDWTYRVFTGQEVIESVLLAGFRITVADLWADAEVEEMGHQE